MQWLKPRNHSDNSLNGILLLALLVALTVLAIWISSAPAVHADETGGTVITIDTSEDLNPGSNTQTCTYSHGGLFIPAGDGCTLRRALREASGRPPGDRPITINFNLASNDPGANLEVDGTWTLEVNGANALPVLKTLSISDPTGLVTIDGATQPGGRTNGPKIIIDTHDRSLEVESTDNVFKNLAFKGGGVILIKAIADGNLVENIWMGLTDNGQSIAFRTPGQPNRMAGGGIFIMSDNNIVRNNVISGAFARAVSIDGGDNNLIEDNLIGTRSDGTVPAVAPAIECLRSLSLDPNNWYGGWGISLSGTGNQVINNRIAGLHIIQSTNDTPPMAIEIFGFDQEVQDNIIGLDSANKSVGVCGQGIKVAGNGTQIIDNTIVRSRTGFEDAEETAMFSSDSSPQFGSVTVRGNIVRDGPGDIYIFGAGIPQALRNYIPAKITTINGVNISGGNGDASPCGGCIIDFYLDDTDDIAEALQHLGSTTANGSGNFAFVLPAALQAGQGIRTMSTSSSGGVILNYGAGTTVKNSVLYTPPVAIGTVVITGPTSGNINTEYDYNITVGPANVTKPLDYTITATGFSAQSITGSTSLSLSGPYQWSTPGVKTITVKVENAVGIKTGTLNVTIQGPSNPPPPSGSGKVYIPLIQK